MICRYCHKELESTWKACPFCGNAVKTTKQRGNASRRGNGQGSAYKRGKTWTAKVVVGWLLADDGAPHPVTRTKGGFRTKAEALDYCASLRTEERSDMTNDTLQQFYARWEEHYTGRIKPHSMDSYRSAIKHFAPLFHLPFASLRTSDLQACIDNNANGKRTKENMKTIMRLLYNYAMDNDIVDRNRAKNLYTGDQPKTTRPPITLPELARICRCDDPYAEYVVCMCYLGYRPNEMLSLTKFSYDPINKCLIGGSKTKAGIDRIVTIPPHIQPIIDRRYASNSSEYLFPDIKTGKKLSVRAFREQAFAPLMDKLGIKDRVPYSCRHTYANLLKNVDGSDTDKAALIGHADASMTKYYQAADYDSLRAITDSLEWVGG